MSGIEVAPVQITWRPELPVFASEPYLRTVGDEYGWLGGKDCTGRLRCFLPYTIVRRGFLRMVRFRVETICVGDDFSVEEERAFLHGCLRYFREANAAVVIPATTNTIFRTYPDRATACPYGTYVIDLSQPEDVLWSNLSASHRRKVRQAERSGVTVLSGLEYADAAYWLVRETFRRSRLPFMSHDSFKKMLGGLGKNVKVCVAEHLGEIQGCIVAPFSRYAGYYAYGGSSPKPAVGANHLLHWSLIAELRRLGVLRYDFVGVRIDPLAGSKQAGLAAFKERFGGRLVQGYMWKYPLNRLLASFYNLAVRATRGGDIVDREKHKLRAAT